MNFCFRSTQRMMDISKDLLFQISLHPRNLHQIQQKRNHTFSKSKIIVHRQSIVGDTQNFTARAEQLKTKGEQLDLPFQTWSERDHWCAQMGTKRECALWKKKGVQCRQVGLSLMFPSVFLNHYVEKVNNSGLKNLHSPTFSGCLPLHQKSRSSGLSITT